MNESVLQTEPVLQEPVLQSEPVLQEPVLQPEPVLRLEHLTKNYGSFRALDDLCLDLPSGRIIGLMGPNGSGKTTLIKIAAGLLKNYRGLVQICGIEPSVETKKLVSYLPERTYLDDSKKVSECLDFFEDFYEDFDRERAMHMLTMLGLKPEQIVKTLSKGTKEKLQLVLVMSRRARLYLLDEPIAGVDPAARDYILNTIIANYEQSATILISTHLIYDVEPILDDYVFIRDGKIIMAGVADDLRAQYGKSLDQVFREVFRCY